MSEGNPEQAKSQPAQSRQIRVFISSTFRDMQAERDHLVKFIFPQLRKLCESRGVTWGEVDLRWGVTDEQAAEGKVLPICLEEIKRCRPYFIGLLGERYGWIPETLPTDLVEREDWLKEHLHGKTSVTELEILHGVLNDPKMAGHAFFYFRDPAYLKTIADKDRKDFTAETAKDAAKLNTLKERIRQSKFPVSENYPNPKALGELVLADLTKVINELFPEGSQPDPLEREAMDHEAYSQSRERVYIGRQEYFDRLDNHAAANDTQPLVVLGESGSGKSALLANWVARYRQAHPDALVLQHYIGATPYSADWAAMLRRLMGEFKRRLGLQQDIPDQLDALRSAFPNWLYMANASLARPKGDGGRRPGEGFCKIIIVLDALNQLEDRDGAPDLVWLPPVLPENVRLIVSTLSGRPLDEIQKRHWPTLKVELLSADERRKLIAEYLAQYTKALNAARVERIAAAPPSANPLYLRVLMDELRLVRTHEELEERIGDYLKAESPYALYEKVIARWEQDYEGDSDMVGDTLSLLWAARRGLTETELLQALGKDDEPLPRATWSPLSLAMSDALINRNGLLTFAHDFLRKAVLYAYLPTEQNQQQAHLCLANYFERQPASPRRTYELPWQLAEAHTWQRLQGLLVDKTFFTELWLRNQFDVKSYWAQIEAKSEIRLLCSYRDYFNDCVGNVGIIYWRNLGDLLHDTGHPDEALRVFSALVDQLDTANNLDALQGALMVKALILKDCGDLVEAAALFKREEEICRDLNNQNALNNSRHHQALILKDQGDLDAAMALLQEVERFCRKSAHDSLLACCLGDQAVILAHRGEMEKAMTLLKEQEYICRASGELIGLARCHNNQAVVLKAQGDLNGAIMLLKEKEKTCRNLGDLHSLTSALGNQAVILAHQGNTSRALELFKEEEHICRKLSNLDQLQRSLGNQAVLFKVCKDYDRAMSLHKEQERICRQLGGVKSLADSLGNQAALLLELGHADEALSLAEAAHLLVTGKGYADLDKQIDRIRAAALHRANSSRHSPRADELFSNPSPIYQQTLIPELRDSAATALKRGLWEAAATYLEKLLQQGEPVESVAPDLITALLNAHETVSPHTVTRIETLLAQLASSGHAALAVPLRAKLTAKLAPPKKPWWKFGR